MRTQGEGARGWEEGRAADDGAVRHGAVQDANQAADREQAGAENHRGGEQLLALVDLKKT